MLFATSTHCTWCRRRTSLSAPSPSLGALFDPEDERWVKLAEIEPVVPPYGAGDSFDGWIVLPVLAARSTFALFGSGFGARTRLQIRASAYFVA